MTKPPRFTTRPVDQHVAVVDSETGAEWRCLNQTIAQMTADAANADPTHLRDLTNTPGAPA